MVREKPDSEALRDYKKHFNGHQVVAMARVILEPFYPSRTVYRLADHCEDNFDFLDGRSEISLDRKTLIGLALLLDVTKLVAIGAVAHSVYQSSI